MESKKCTSCNQEKPISDFYVKKGSKNGQSKCKDCFNKYCVLRWKNRKIKFIQEKGSKCLDCGVSYPEYPYVIFDFHHLDPNTKDVDWTKLRLRNEDKIREELDNCSLLCSNCHRMRHHFEI
jgi:hypothetical protein